MRVTGCIVLMLTAVASGQPLTQDPGTWKPWSFEASATRVQHYAATARELQDFEARLRQLRTIMASASAVAEPRGFDPSFEGSLSDFDARNQAHPKEVPLSAVLYFGAFEHFEFTRNGETRRGASGEAHLLPFLINELSPKFESATVPRDWIEVTGEVFLEPPDRGELAGLPRRGDMLIIKNNPAPLWIPVTVPEAIDLIVQQARRHSADCERAAASDRRNYEDAIAPATQARIEHNWEQLAARQPDPAAYLAHVQEIRRRNIEGLRQIAESNTPTGNRLWAAAIQQIDAGQQALGSLSEVERTAPACYHQNAPTTSPRARLGIVGDANCVPIVRPNRQYFDRRLPRSAVQLITIMRIDQCTDKLSSGSPAAAGCATNIAMLRTVDWHTVKAQMDR